MERLRNWQPAEDELKSSSEFPVNWPVFIKNFREYGLIPTSSECKYTLDASTAPKWIGALADILCKVVRILDKYSRAQSDFLDKEGVGAVEMYTRLVYQFFCIPELRDLFALESLTRITPVGYLQHVTDYLPVLPEDMPLGLRESKDEDSLFRCLRTLATWQQAVHSLFGVPDRLATLSSLRACFVTLGGSQTLRGRSSEFEAMLQKFDPGARQVAKTWMDEQLVKCRGTEATRVHAEAGLLLLAHSGPQRNPIVHSERAEDQVFGLTRKVCSTRFRVI